MLNLLAMPLLISIETKGHSGGRNRRGRGRSEDLPGVGQTREK